MTDQQPELTEADYDIDIGVLMQILGVDPSTVRADSARLEFLSGKVLMRYEVVRAVPGKMLAIAMANASGLIAPQPPQEQFEQGLPPGVPDEPTVEQVEDASGPLIDQRVTPIRPTKAGRRTAAKKAVSTVRKQTARKTTKAAKKS